LSANDNEALRTLLQMMSTNTMITTSPTNSFAMMQIFEKFESIIRFEDFQEREEMNEFALKCGRTDLANRISSFPLMNVINQQ